MSELDAQLSEVAERILGVWHRATGLGPDGLARCCIAIALVCSMLEAHAGAPIIASVGVVAAAIHAWLVEVVAVARRRDDRAVIAAHESGAMLSRTLWLGFAVIVLGVGPDWTAATSLRNLAFALLLHVIFLDEPPPRPHHAGVDQLACTMSQLSPPSIGHSS